MISDQTTRRLPQFSQPFSARNRVHHISNDELMALLEGHDSNRLALRCMGDARRERDSLRRERDNLASELAELRPCDQRARALLAGVLGGGADATCSVDNLAALATGEMIGARRELESDLGPTETRYPINVLAAKVVCSKLDAVNLAGRTRTNLESMKGQRDAAQSLAAGAERELTEVRELLKPALGDTISDYMTTPGLARAVAARVADLQGRVSRLAAQARTGKFAGPPKSAPTPRPLRTGYRSENGVYHPAPDTRDFDRHAGVCEKCAAERTSLGVKVDEPAPSQIEPPLEPALAGNLRALLGSIGLCPPSSWIDGAAAGLAQVAKLAAAASPTGTGCRPALSREDAEIIAEALDHLHASTVRIVDREGRQFVPALAELVDRQQHLLEMFEGLLVEGLLAEVSS